MSILQAALLGILQGVTEFLPVSSSGHLVLARALMNIAEIPVLFDVILHMATLLVVLWVFREKVGGILGALFRFILRKSRGDDRPLLHLALKLLVASAVTAVIGLGVSALDIREEPGTVSLLLLVTAAILIATRFARGTTDMDRMSWTQVLAIGAAQGIGVFPGISRSGITIGCGLLTGLDRRSAGEFSFLLSLPAVTGAFLLTLKDAAELSRSVPAAALVIGFLTAAIAGYGSLKLLLRLVYGGRLWIFALYLVPAAIWGLVRFGL